MSNFFENIGSSPQENLFKAMNSYYPTTGGEGYVAGFKSGFRNNITAMAVDKVDSFVGSFSPVEDETISPDQANEEFTPLKPFTEPVRRVDARIRSRREKFLMEQQAILSQSGISGTAATLSQFSGGMADPLMWAATASTVGAGVGAMNAVRAGNFVKVSRALQALPKLGRGSMIAKELAENVAVAAALEIPLAESLENVYGEKFSNKEHAFNIAVGTLAGTTFRYIGRAFEGKFGRPRNVDQDRTSAIVSKELMDSEVKGKAPDYEAAQKRDVQATVERVNNTEHQTRTAEIFEDSGTGGTFYTTHKAGETDLVPSQVRYGTSLGEGLYMAKSSVLAEAKALHLPEADIAKFQIDELKVLDLDEVADEALFASFKDFIAREAPNAKVLKDMVAQDNYKKILKIIDEFEESAPDSVFQSRVNSFFAEQGIDGYKFVEDFFEGAAGDAVFIFRPSDQLNNSMVKKYKSNAENRGAGIEEPERISADEAIEITTEREVEFVGDDPIYRVESDKIKEDLIRAYDPEVLDAPDTTAVKAVQDMAEDIDEGAAALKQLEVDTSKFDADKKKITDTEQAGKATIVCGRTN